MAITGKVFVTGATGFIGTRLVQALIERGHSIRALSRRDHPEPPPGLEGTAGHPLDHEQVERVRGDITDRDSMARAIEGCSHVFHLAAYAKNWAPDPRTYFRMNVQGMRNVFDAAAGHGVQRVVWTSSIVTFGPTRRGETGNEDMPRITDRYFTEYEETKSVAEKEALQRAADGFPVVIVNPTRVFGPGRLTEGNSLSKLIDDYDRGKAPFLPRRGINVGNYVLVDDVAEGHVLAMEKGRPGQRYILGSENVSLRGFFKLVDEASGRRHLKVPAPPPIALFFAWLQKKRAEWFGSYPVITPGWVRTFLVDWTYSCEKAKNELGYRPTLLADAVRTTCRWLQGLRK